MYPKIPPITEAQKTPIFAWRMCCGSVNANELINNDIVNPTEANKPTPYKCLLFIPSGRGEIFNFINNKETPTTPINFPKSKPKITPKKKLFTKRKSTLDPKVI